MQAHERTDRHADAYASRVVCNEFSGNFRGVMRNSNKTVADWLLRHTLLAPADIVVILRAPGLS